MAELIKKAYFKNTLGITQSAKLYTTLAEVSSQGIPLVVDSTRVYMKYGETSDPLATSARVNRYSNLIPEANRNFTNWSAFGGSTATLTQNIAMPEWGTTQATKIHLTGGSSIWKYMFSLAAPPANTTCRSKLLIKNTGAKSIVVHGNGITPNITVSAGRSTYLNHSGVADGTKAFQMVLTASTITDDLDVIVYAPEMYYDSTSAIKAILSQAQVAYGSQTYNSNGTFTVPSGVTRVRVTIKGAGGGGGGSMWDQGDSAYLLYQGGNGGKGGYNQQIITVTPGQQMPVVIGGGGRGGSNSRLSTGSPGSGSNGGASSFFAISATGGGGGGGATASSNGSTGTNGTPVGAGAGGGAGSLGTGFGEGGWGASGSILVEWGGGI